MKYFFLSVSLFLLSAIALPTFAADWTALKSPDAQTLRSIVQSGPNLVTVGNSGNIFYSADQGVAWMQSLKTFSGWLYGLSEVPGGALATVGDGGVVLQSLDHGATWSQLNLGATKNLNAISSNGTSAYIVGSNGTFLSYFANGNQWSVQSVGSSLNLTGVEAVDGNIAWVTGAEGTLIKTSQNGLSYFKIVLNTPETLNAVHFISPTVGFVVGTKGIILKTTDGGNVWNPVTVSGVTDQTLYSVDSSGTHIAIAGDRVLITSDDSGTTWNVKSFDGTVKKFYDVAFTSSTDAFAVGSDNDANALASHLSLVTPTPVPTPTPPATNGYPQEAPLQTIAQNSLVKLRCLATSTSSDPCRAVYFYATDGNRHAFTNDKVYFSWFTDFSTVKEVVPDFLASLPLGKNVTYRPGVKMVKFQTSPTVYVVAKGGVLRAIATEQIAAALYGATWNKQIDDISDVFYKNYSIGVPVNSSTDYDPAQARILVGSLSENF